MEEQFQFFATQQIQEIYQKTAQKSYVYLKENDRLLPL